MKSFFYIFILAFFTLIAVSVSSANADTTPTPTPTPIFLGGMDLNNYCASLNQGGAVVNGTVWDCTGNNQVIDLTAACVWQYSISDAFATEIRLGDVYSYACYSNTQGVTQTPSPTPTITLTPTPSGLPPTDLGGMDLNSYCAALTEGTAILNGSTWSCTGNNLPIDLNTACNWQYAVSNAFAQEVAPGNPYTYQCFVQNASTTPTPTSTLTPTSTPSITPSVTPTATPSATDDWATYKYNAQRSSYNPNETIINATSAANLIQKLDLPCATSPCSALVATPGAVLSDAPAVVNNVMYYGDWTGNFYAKNVKDGSTIWSQNLGTMTPPAANNCSPKSVGVVSSPSVRDISVNGVQTAIVFITGADGNVYALKAADGSVLWKTKLADPSKGELLWDSPSEANGSVYVGVASLGDCPLVQGRMYRLGWRFGDIQAVAKLVPDGCVGAGSWASPTYDQTNNKIYIATGTQDNSCKVNGQKIVEPNAIALVELDGTTLNIVDAARIPASGQGPDSDYGVSPTLTTATINGAKTQLVSAANKNGHLYIYKRSALSAGPLYDLMLDKNGINNTCPDCSMGTISTSASDGTTLYQGMGQCSLTNNVTSNCAAPGFNSTMFAINPGTGTIKWQTNIPKQIVSTPILLKDILIVFEGNSVMILNSNTGKLIKQITPTGAGSVLDGTGAVARGQLFFGDLNGNFYKYGL